MLRERSGARFLEVVSKKRAAKQVHTLFWWDVCARLVDGREVGAEEGEREQLATEDGGVENKGGRECRC